MTQEEQHAGTQEAKAQVTRPKRSFGRTVIFVCGNLIVPIIMSGVIVWAYNWLIETAPEAERRSRPRRARLAEFVTVTLADHDAKITAFGSVVPARMVDLKPRVNGSIDAIGANFEPGGLFKQGAPLVWIDQERFRLTQEIATQELVRAGEDIKAQQGQVDAAKAALSVELGRSEVARQEYQLMGIEVNDESKLDRLLRKPQLAQARSALQSAEAKIAVAEAAKRVAATRLEEATLDCDRTTVKAPFNATVIERFAEVGDHAATSSSLARLCSTDSSWLEVSIPNGSLAWLEIPAESTVGKQSDEGKKDSGSNSELGLGSTVKIFHDHVWGQGVSRQARIVRLLPMRSTTGRQARLLLAIDDPFCLQAKNKQVPKLLLNSFVRVEITGRKMKAVAKIRRDTLHEGKVVWIADSDDKLQLRTVEPIWSSKDFVFLSAEQLPMGERLIVSVIPTPVPGLALRLRPQSEPKDQKMGR